MNFVSPKNLAVGDRIKSRTGHRAVVIHTAKVGSVYEVDVQTEDRHETWVIRQDERILRSCEPVVATLRDSAEITAEITAPLFLTDDDITNPSIPRFECWD